MLPEHDLVIAYQGATLDTRRRCAHSGPSSTPSRSPPRRAADGAGGAGECRPVRSAPRFLPRAIVGCATRCRSARGPFDTTGLSLVDAPEIGAADGWILTLPGVGGCRSTPVARVRALASENQTPEAQGPETAWGRISGLWNAVRPPRPRERGGPATTDRCSCMWSATSAPGDRGARARRRSAPVTSAAVARLGKGCTSGIRHAPADTAPAARPTAPITTHAAALLLDMDGTLVDSHRRQLWTNWSLAHGVDQQTLAIIHGRQGRTRWRCCCPTARTTRTSPRTACSSPPDGADRRRRRDRRPAQLLGDLTDLPHALVTSAAETSRRRAWMRGPHARRAVTAERCAQQARPGFVAAARALGVDPAAASWSKTRRTASPRGSRPACA